MVDKSGSVPVQIEHLLGIVRRLRDPDQGCPWDVGQTFQSIVPHTIEEAYELADAIESNDFDQIREEAGDVLFQVLFYAQMADEKQHFNFADVVDGLSEKLIRRHPHVFSRNSTAQQETPIAVSDVSDSWEKIKRTERQGKQQSGILDDIPVSLPALTRAQKIQKRASRVGFDWADMAGVFEKLEEEICELKEALVEGEKAAIESELGDVLFCVVNLARHLDFDAETAMRGATRKFEGRFRLMEEQAIASGSRLEDESVSTLEARWQTAKRDLSQIE
ncbi:MAG: nucleoside triphosphate pyrophosphohydrolase [Halieaceae bacterium]|nr:nucleoside triphosphate pyrophosphohydrolase [Halieaceae bacterium]|tara:strand:- start:56 stop:886 length:831 start_codon:yes stop_codon:yes gene_type:complete